MLAMPGLRAFSLSAVRDSGRVSCGAHGLFVGDVHLLQRHCVGGAFARWSVRPLIDLNRELSFCYRLPVDVAAKATALALIAQAFNCNDQATAAIAAVHLQFPDPPPMAKAAETTEGLRRRAAELRRSGLLKTDPEWDAKHPRTGAPPNPGWFTPVTHADRPIEVSMADKPQQWHLPFEELPTGGGGGGGGNPFSARVSPTGPARSAPRAAPLPAAEPQPTLPFPEGLPLKLAPYTGGKTYGILQTPDATIELQSGYAGPAADMPPGTRGFDRLTLSHVEGHAAALMQQQGIAEGTLYINNPKICGSCMRLLPRMLPPGASLDVVLPNKTVFHFKGVAP